MASRFFLSWSKRKRLPGTVQYRLLLQTESDNNNKGRGFVPSVPEQKEKVIKTKYGLVV